MYNPQEIEKEILKFWEKNKIFQKLMKKNKGKKQYSFIDGPITANNPMGVHHAWGRTYKDIYQRWKAMQGFDQRFQNGFDCQGLHVEVGVEKELKFNSKKEIEKFGLDKFSRECRKSVEKFAKIQTEQSIRLGQWMDWNNSYFTMSDDNIESIWYFLKKCNDNKWLYKGTRILPWCTRCGTSSSQHEMSDEGYEELTHTAVYVRAKLKNRENEYLLIWTTTEWTLSSNVVAAVNPSLDYVKIQKGDSIYYLSEKTTKKIGEHKVLKKFKGKELIGLEYESFYPEFKVQRNVKPKVVPWNEVGEEEGTGIVHIAPTCGEEDFELGKEKKLLFIDPALDEEGNFHDGFGWLSGKNVAEVKQEIIKDLEERNLLFKTEQYKHRYPVCWRCKEELVFRLGSEWFISCDKIRSLMKKAAKNVEWQPRHIGKLMQDWLTNMQDWNISRKRYWGLPLMLYECECGNLEVIGSLKELRQKAVNKKDVDKLPELHRPWIDKIKIKCSKCKKEVERIREVGDCWLDAGIVPFSTLNYFSDRKYWKKWFPAELVIEMRAQVRLWFYSMLFMSMTLENKCPYKKVFAHESLRDENGRPMHKSLGNAIWFDEAVEKMGADIMRWIYSSHNPQFNLNFGYKAAGEVKSRLTLLFNLSNYLQQSLTNLKKPATLEIEDQWLISRLNLLIKEVTIDLEQLKPNIATKRIEDFFTFDISRTYIQIVRDRIQTETGKNKDAALFTFYTALITTLKIMAPFTPFLSEYLYQKYFRKYEKAESIHLMDWPKFDVNKINKKLEEKMEITKEIIQEILAQREKAKIGIRWPLQEAVIEIKEKINTAQIIKKQTNIKNLIIKEGKKTKIKLNTKLTPELEQEGFSREITRRIQALRKQANLQKKDKIELVIFSEYDLSKFKKEIQEITGAKTLQFTKAPKKYEFSSEERIKGEIFTIHFNRI